MPYLTKEWLEYLMRASERQEAEVVFARSEHGRNRCALAGTRMRPAMHAAFDAGMRKVTDALKRVPHRST